MSQFTALEIAEFLREIGDRMVLSGENPYRARANIRAAEISPSVLSRLLKKSASQKFPASGGTGYVKKHRRSEITNCLKPKGVS